jgi:cytosine/adenosine deaminase-related metal-dependent hydrolase
MSVTRVFTAPVVVPVITAPIDDGAVVVVDDRIAAVGRRDDVMPLHPGVEEFVLDGVMTPGLVNAHSHLQFTAFFNLGTDAHEGFEAWSVAFDAEYSSRGHRQDWYQSAAEGAALAVQSGTTTIADVATDFQAAVALVDSGLSGVVFLEVLGNSWVQWRAEGRARFLEDIDQARALETRRVKIGISPHAPYSLDTRVLADLGHLASKHGIRVHTHLAESAFEDEYCRFGTGPLADFVAGFGGDFRIIVEGGASRGTAEFAEFVGLLGPESHVAHGIYLDRAGRAILRREHTAVALCPRSNSVIGLHQPPIASYLVERSPIAVGTDSLASAPSLDLMEDVRLLYDIAVEQGYEHTDLATRLLTAATLGGAIALGLDSEDGIGVLSPGRFADLAVFDIGASAGTVEKRLVLDGAGRCSATFISGELVERRTDAHSRSGRRTVQ